MKFQAVVKDAKVSADKVIVTILGGDGLSIDKLRMYFGEPVTVDIEIIQPTLPIDDADGYFLVDGNGEIVG